MSKIVLSTDKAPAAIGPYSQAIEANGFIFCSGQLPMDPSTGALVSSSAADAARQVLENLTAVLASAGLGREHVVKVTIFLNDIDDFAAVNEVYAEYFPDEPPARACVEVNRLPKDALVEMEAIAMAQN